MGFSQRLILGFGRHARVLAIAAAALASSLNGAHAGFFDFLFGPQPVLRSPAPGYPGGMGPRWHPHAYFHARRPRVVVLHHRHLAAVEKTRHAAGSHAAPGIMEDDSLQDGDAVMTERGIRVFTGDDSRDHHKPEEFAKLSETKGLSSRARAALTAIDAHRSEGGGSLLRGPDVVTGRSAADSKVSEGELITDPRGRVIRYVGP
ncbi:hypothetical protein RZS28_13115 [Methylocapsa polymorpha]|uniref:Uncharacterized protein n=1 Tax=Methylocapsa polymorpha TaxID=3080828 RepID=A0ABZ0HQB7_9HYPH|nr:hypothetical protein RZS28_13115 [Methylocapsa sp. RX1]